MFCKIKLTVKPEKASEEINSVVWDFLNALEKNGQILKGYKYITAGDERFLYVTLPKSHSLDEIHDSVFVKQNRQSLTDIFDVAVEYIGEDNDSMAYCDCKSHSALEMATFYYDLDSPVVCCDCGKPVALYELPEYLNQEDRSALRLWQENYGAMDILWMSCLCDRYTGRQLTNPKSALLKDGREIAEDLEKKLGCKVYLNIIDDLDFYLKNDKWVDVGGEMRRICPGCGQPMQLYENADGTYRINRCEACRLSSDCFKEGVI